MPLASFGMIGTFIHRRRPLWGSVAPLRRAAAVSGVSAVVGVIGVIGVLATGLVGCAKPPTLIATEVSADSTVPPLLVLQYTATRASDPTRVASGSIVSLAPGDAGDGRGAFVFPLRLAVGPLAGWSGPVEITINGRDWVTDAIVASGKTTGEAIPEQTSQATVTLTAVSPPGNADAGTAGDTTPDTTSGAANDAGTDGATGS